MPRSGDPALLDTVEHVLREGVEVAGSRARMGERGFNGFMDRMSLVDPSDPSRAFQAIQRPAHAQAIQEAFAWSLARRLGIDYLFPAAVVRPDGTAMVRMVPGVASGSVGIVDTVGLERIAARWYERNMPHMGAEAIALQARVDRELLTVVDYLMANHDRGNANLLIDVAEGGFRAVDMGWATGGERMLRPTVPSMMQAFTGGTRGVLDLHPETVAVIRANLQPDDLRELHIGLREAAQAYRPGPDARRDQRMLQRALTHYLSSDEFLERLLARRAVVAEHGQVVYHVPRELTRTPAAVAGTVARAYPSQVAAAGIGVGAAATGAWLLHERG